MTRTRCPACSTVFRVTSDQLRAKAGKVRCGYCQTVFNAFDELVDETPAAAVPPVVEPPVLAEDVPEYSPDRSLAPDKLSTLPEAADASEAAIAAGSEVEMQDTAEDEPVQAQEAESAPPEQAGRGLEENAPESVLTATDPTPSRLGFAGEPADDSTLAARQAGLVAGRELSETPAYDRWAAGTLAGAAAGGFGGTEARRATWPLVLGALLLLAVLLAQLAYYFRSDLVRLLPVAADIFAALDVPVPLPTHSDLVSIEASDLQADNARGLFILDAALRNRADFAQAWPALELTLTDAGDVPLARRVMNAADYLPPGSELSVFPANAEIPVRLWIDAKGLGAYGYRLYVFYP